MIAIIDYGVGNLASLKYALSDFTSEFITTSDIDTMEKSDVLLLPGVGHAGYAMDQLNKTGLTEYLKSTDKPMIGICLGMQLLYENSDESEIPLLGKIPGRLTEFSDQSLPKIHMGWNTINQDQDAYFVHSFAAPINEFTYGRTTYSREFTSIVKRNQIIGFQFHPEKSGAHGIELLKSAAEGSL